MKRKLSIAIDENIANQVDKHAKKLRLNRSQMIENCLEVALMDLRLLKMIGVLDAVSVVRDYQQKVGIAKVEVQKALLT